MTETAEYTCGVSPDVALRQRVTAALGLPTDATDQAIAGATVSRLAARRSHTLSPRKVAGRKPDTGPEPYMAVSPVEPEPRPLLSAQHDPASLFPPSYWAWRHGQDR